MTWETWWAGAEMGDVTYYGIQKLESEGLIPLIEAIYEPLWSPEKLAAYALQAVVTACLANSALLAFRCDRDFTTPIWTAAHQKAWDLGEPDGPTMYVSSVGVWTRSFEHGRVVMNPTAKPFGNCAAHSAQIVLDR